MPKWPQSRLQQALISLLAGSVTAVTIAIRTDNNAYARLVREYPRDGQIGLQVFGEAVAAGALTLIVVTGVVFLLQRALTNRSPL